MGLYGVCGWAPSLARCIGFNNSANKRLLSLFFKHPGVTTPPQFSVLRQFVNSQFAIAIGTPPKVPLTTTNDNLMTGN